MWGRVGQVGRVRRVGGGVVFWESGGRTSRASLLSMKGTPDTER